MSTATSGRAREHKVRDHLDAATNATEPEADDAAGEPGQ